MTERVVHELKGTISSVGFESGDRFVVGVWRESPVGPLADVMWAQPDGTRVLLAPDEGAAEFVASVYRFDDVRVVPFEVRTATARQLDLDAGPLSLELSARRGVTLGVTRPAWFTRRVEGPIAKRLMNVVTYGTSPTGVEEWYRAASFRLVDSATGRVDGHDLGGRRPVQPGLGVGFSEPPRWPSIVSVRPRLRSAPGVVRVPSRAPTDLG